MFKWFWTTFLFGNSIYLGVEETVNFLSFVNFYPADQARINVEWNLKKLGQLYQVLIPCLQKSPKI